MLVRFLFVLLCFCAASASATFVTLDPTAIATSDQWDSTGGASTKTIAITDATDGTYIWTATNNFTDRYDVEDLPDDCEENFVDSVWVFWTAQDNGNGNNRARIGLRIKDDELWGSADALTTSWVERKEVFINPPGSRGSWDLVEFDSVEVQINCTAIGSSREVRMTSCSLVVFYRSIDRTLMFPYKDDACLTSADYDHDLLRKSFMQNDTAFTRLGGGTSTHNDYWKTGDQASAYHKMNNADWETGGFGVFFDAVNVKSDCSLTIIIQRYNSSCALQESTPNYPASGAQLLIDTTGHYEFQIPQHDWSSGACGDELAVRFLWTNVDIGEPEDSIWIRYGVADTYFEHEIVINQSPCPAGEGAGGCAGQPATDVLTSVPNDSGEASFNDFISNDGGNKITYIADATDGNYMLSDAASEHQHIRFAGITEPADFVSYDSITVEFRAQKGGSGANRLRLRTRLEDSTNTANYCENTYTRVNNDSWISFDETEPSLLTISGTPSGNQTCEGAMTEANIEKLQVHFIMAQLSTGRECQITSVDLVICYTFSSGGGGGQVMRIRLGIKDDPLDWAEKQWWAGREHPLYPNRGLVWSVRNSKRWLWE